MKIGFFAFMLIFFLSMLTYVCIRGGQALSSFGTLKGVFIASSIVLFLMFFVGMILGNYFPLPVAKTITFLGNTFLVVMIYLTFAFLITDITLIFNKMFHFITNDTYTFRFWALMISSLVIFTVMTVGNYKFNHPQVVNLHITTEKLPQQKEIKIVAISDVHLGVSIDKNRLKKYVELINAQQPDLVIVGGDLVDRSIVPLERQKMHEDLLQIKAPMGVYATLGNHEYYGEGMNRIEDFYKKSGITLLKDSAVLVQNQFFIAGREDDRMQPNRKKLEEILQNIDHSKPIILLDHQPLFLNEAEKNHVDFQFSGHTHNGQFFPGNLFVKRMFELGYGFKKKGNTHYYVSSGLGLWGPQYRIGSQSELVVIDFKY